MFNTITTSFQHSLHAAGEASIGRRLRDGLKGFHEEERGNGPMDTIMLVFVSVMILLGLTKVLLPQVWNKVKGEIGNLIGFRLG